MTSKMKWLSLWLFDNPLLATGPSPSAHPRAGRGNLAQNVPLGVLSGVELLVGMLGEVVRPLLRVDVRRIAVWKTILRKIQKGLDDPAYDYVIQTAPFRRNSISRR